MTLRDRSVATLEEELIEHQGSMSVDYLADHGWQVRLSNPGGSLYVQACEGAEKWPSDGGPSLDDTIAKAINRATSEGWW